MNKEVYKEMCNEIYEGGNWDRMINCLEKKDKEIERLNEEIMQMRKLYFDLKDRIDKAIEYINNLKTYPYLEKYYIKDLEEILKGE